MSIWRTRSVDVEADILVETSAGRLRLSGNGSVLTLSLLDPSGLPRLGRWPFAVRRSRRARVFSRTARLLELLGVEVRIESGQREIARIGHGVRGTFLARLLALNGLRLPVWPLIQALRGPAVNERR